MKKLFALIFLLFTLASSVEAQKSTVDVFYTNGVPSACFIGTLYVNKLTGDIYSYKLGIGCILSGSVTPALSGSGANGRVAFWSGASTLSSVSGFTFDGTNLVVTGGRITATEFDSDSTNLANNGTIRLGKSDFIAWRNEANSGNILLSKDSSNRIASSGGFAGALTGNVTGDVTGNVTGSVTGTASGNELPLTFSSPLSRSVNTISCSTCALNTSGLSQFPSASTQSSQVRAIISDETGSGNMVFATSPTLATPILGVATATSINGNTFTTGTYTITGGAGKTFTFNNSIAISGTDSTVMTLPSTSATIARTDAGQTFTGTQLFSRMRGTGSSVVDFQLDNNSAGLGLGDGQFVSWNSNNDGSGRDTSLSRAGAGIVRIGTTANNNSGLMQLSGMKIGGTVSRGTTEGTNHLDIFNGTAPAGTLANGISLFSTTGELHVLDAAGNDTLLSPHEKITNQWIYRSKNTVTGENLEIDMERMMRALDKLLGGGYVRDNNIDNIQNISPLYSTYLFGNSFFNYAYSPVANIGGTQVLTPTAGTTVTLTIDTTAKDIIASETAAQDQSIVISGTPQDGTRLTIIVTNDGVLPRTITASTGLSALSTVIGVVSKKSTISFIALNGTFIETGRTVGI